MPEYKHASFTGEQLVLENPHIRLEMNKRISGWGWGEIFTPAGKLMGVLDHLGEVMLSGQEIPMRLEAQDVRREADETGEKLIFEVKSAIVQEKLRGTSFDGWINYPLSQHVITGEVTLSISPGEPIVFLNYRLKSTGNIFVHYIRGPWLKAGEASFGTAKTDAIFPGIEWLEGDEWSSGTDWFKDPWAMKVIPHPNKVSIPVMALSHDGDGIGLAWNPNKVATQWFNYRHHLPQPVFAIPNFIDRMNNNLMGLMLPDVQIEAQENRVNSNPPMEMHPEQPVEFDAEIFLSCGDSLQVIIDWVKRHGLPQEEKPRWTLEEAIHRIAAAYNGHFWHEGKGFGLGQTPDDIGLNPPIFAKKYIDKYKGTPLANELASKIKWCEEQPDYNAREYERLEVKSSNELEEGKKLLSFQCKDGSFPFEPDGPHYVKDDFVVSRAYLEPMGLTGDTALDICILPAMKLLIMAQKNGEKQFVDGALKALDYCMEMKRPEGGDNWETPLHSPNLLAAGHAAVAYYLGYKASTRQEYLTKAIYWLRTLLPFTHLWEPEDMKMLYNTKPCLCCSDWFFANWVRDHVQWEVLETFSLSTKLDIDWGKIDGEIDWRRYQEGVTFAAVRWMVDHAKKKWRPHNLPKTLPIYEKGGFDCCLPDTFNSTTGNYGGACMMPDAIACNIMALLG